MRQDRYACLHRLTKGIKGTDDDCLGSFTLLLSSAEGEFMINMSHLVQQLRKELQRAENEVSRFRAALSALVSPTSNGHRRTLSADARRRISLAQKARWAKQNGRAEAAGPKRIVSSAARRKMAAAQRARWAKVKGLKKAA